MSKVTIVLEPEFKEGADHERLEREMTRILENRGAEVKWNQSKTKVSATWVGDDAEYESRATGMFFMNHVGGPIGIKGWQVKK